MTEGEVLGCECPCGLWHYLDCCDGYAVTCRCVADFLVLMCEPCAAHVDAARARSPH